MAEMTSFYTNEIQDLSDWNDICGELFCVQNLTRTKTGLHKYFVDCYLSYLENEVFKASAERTDDTYESIILKAQNDAKQIIELAQQHAARILKDAERRFNSTATPLQKIRTVL